MSTGWNQSALRAIPARIINLLGNEYWLELEAHTSCMKLHYKPTGK